MGHLDRSVYLYFIFILCLTSAKVLVNCSMCSRCTPFSVIIQFCRMAFASLHQRFLISNREKQRCQVEGEHNKSKFLKIGGNNQIKRGMQDIFVNFSLNRSLPRIMKLLSTAVLTEKHEVCSLIFFSPRKNPLASFQKL